MEADLARSFEQEYGNGGDKLSSILKEMIESGNQVLAVDYNNAVGSVNELYSHFGKIFEWHDAIITPAFAIFWNHRVNCGCLSPETSSK